MKKSLLTIFICVIGNFAFGQANPVQHLEWNHSYDSTNYRNIFAASWWEPAEPHNALVGYNVYRNNEFYKFFSVTTFGCNPDWGATEDCDFLNVNGGGPFTAQVTAVYQDGEESAPATFDVRGILLNVNDFSINKLSIFPNPAKDVLNFSEEFSSIKIADVSGKLFIQSAKPEKSINISKLTKGVYVISAVSKSGKVINSKFVKE